VAAGLLLAALGACSNGNGAGGGNQKLTVFIASSLSGAFTTLESEFEKSHPGVQVVLSPNSSTTLAEQIKAGAPADVIATADQASMQIVQQAGDAAAAPVQFATNTLVIAVPPSNPGHVTGVQSLSGASFITCVTTAPCGAAAQEMLAQAGITAKPKSYEEDAATTLTVVESGNVDAGIVYVTDAKSAAGKVKTIPIPSADNVVNPYYIAAVKGSKQAQLAQEWIALVRSQEGQQVLQKAGFGPA
jgi:molybdate transport system substrate-binding protein